jgi:hypothetical protein
MFLGPQGGLITWLTSDTQGCVDFTLNQAGPGLPPASSAAATTTSSAPLPTVGIIETDCNSKNTDPNLIQLTGDVAPAIPVFCNNANNLQTASGPSEDKEANGTQIYLGMSAYRQAGPQNLCQGGSVNIDVSVDQCIAVLQAAASCE